jgi:hypothetical protein
MTTVQSRVEKLERQTSESSDLLSLAQWVGPDRYRLSDGREVTRRELERIVESTPGRLPFIVLDR